MWQHVWCERRLDKLSIGGKNWSMRCVSPPPCNSRHHKRSRPIDLVLEDVSACDAQPGNEFLCSSKTTCNPSWCIGTWALVFALLASSLSKWHCSAYMCFPYSCSETCNCKDFVAVHAIQLVPTSSSMVWRIRGTYN